MNVGEKIRFLRVVEGSLRGLGRPMTQQEVVQAVRKQFRASLSQSYLSQIESGARPHLTNKTRALLAGFFRVYPGFLVDDPEGYSTALTSHAPTPEGKLDAWLFSGAHQFGADEELAAALHTMAEEPDSRRTLLLASEILRAPGLSERLWEVLRPRG